MGGAGALDGIILVVLAYEACKIHVGKTMFAQSHIVCENDRHRVDDSRLSAHWSRVNHFGSCFRKIHRSYGI